MRVLRKTAMADDIRRASWVIAAQTAALILVIFATVGGAFYLTYHRSLDNAEQQLLTDATATIDRPAEAPSGVWVTVREGNTQYQSVGMPDELPDQAALDLVDARGGTETTTVRLHGHEFLVRTERVGNHTTQAAIDLKEREDEDHRIAGAGILAALLAVVLAGGTSALLARRAVKPLAEALERQRRFVADASHELRTPLTHLSTRVQMLSRRGPAALTPSDLEAVEDDTRALGDILDDLLAASDTRRQPHEPIELDDLVTSCIDATRPYATKRGVHLDVSTEPGPEISGVPLALRRAITALVDNAVDHAHSQVEVRLRFLRRTAVVEVTDDGTGIEPEVLPHVFERFAGTRTAQTPDADGRRHYGIGLALVADIAAAHGGSVKASARTDGLSGTTFILTVPHGLVGT